jgi:hypothetical protein
LTDARLPGSWLYTLPWVALSNDARALLASALMWCAQQETDGATPDAVLGALPGVSPAAIKELQGAGILCRTDDGWQLLQDWGATQTPRAQHEQRRKNTRERVNRHRNKPARNAVTNPVANAASNAIGNGLLRGQDRTGQAAVKERDQQKADDNAKLQIAGESA